MLSPYITIVLWTGLCGVLSNMPQGKKQLQKLEPDSYGYPVLRYKFIWALLIFLPVIIMAATRRNFGDTEVYRRGFLAMTPSIREFAAGFTEIKKDRGFEVLKFIIKRFITKNDVTYFFIIALIQGGSLVYVYRKYSENYIMSILMFLLSTDYLSWMFNGMRQFTAAAMLFACIGLILKKRYVWAVVMVLLMSTIHGSAILMLPMIFVAQGKAWNKKVIVFTVAIVFAIMFLGQFTNLLDSMLSDTQYSSTIGDEIWAQDDGTSAMRVLFYSLPAIISFFGRHRIWAVNDPVINLSTNMSIISAGIYLMSMVTSGIYVGRLPIYFSLYGYILLPWLANHMFTKESGKFVNIVMICGFLLFYYVQMHVVWGIF